jgi:hypothetical protein
MRFTAISSPTCPMIFNFPPHWRQMSGSASYAWLTSLAQLSGQRFVVVGSGGTADASDSRREGLILPCVAAAEECPVLTWVPNVTGHPAR